jgi:hypothetical protein
MMLKFHFVIARVSHFVTGRGTLALLENVSAKVKMVVTLATVVFRFVKLDRGVVFVFE